MAGKYIGVTDDAVNAGIAEGRFSEAEIRQIRDSGGRFVKHIKQLSHSNSILPASVIQIYQVYIYQADLRPIMEAMARARDVQIADDLSERYRLVLSKLERFLNHKRILESLNDVAGDAAEIFELRLTPMLEKVDHRDPDVVACTALISMLRAHVNIEFIYLLSTFWLDRDSVSSDTGLARRISELERKVQRNLEQMLAYQFDIRNGFMLRDSLYGKYLLQGRNGVHHLQQFLEHDSRFTSFADFMQMISRRFLVYTGDTDFFGNPVGDASFGFNFTIDQIQFEHDKRHNLVCGLREVLCDIQQLRRIYEELKGAGTIEPADIQFEPGSDAPGPIRLTAIPLKLPKPTPH